MVCSYVVFAACVLTEIFGDRKIGVRFGFLQCVFSSLVVKLVALDLLCWFSPSSAVMTQVVVSCFRDATLQPFGFALRAYGVTSPAFSS